MMSRVWRGKFIQSIDDYFAAFNHVYDEKNLGTPWKAGKVASVKMAFKDAQKKRAREAGMTAGSMRVEVPPSLAWAMLEAAPRAATSLDKAFYAIFWVMLLFFFRADTMAGIQLAALF